MNQNSIPCATAYEIKLPQDIIDILCRDLDTSFTDTEPATLSSGVVDSTVRQSELVEINETYWGVGFLMHYINLQNKYNFGYDLSGGLDQQKIQYIQYGVGGHYTWHTDVSPPNRYIRKLSFTLQLSDEDEYEGGELQLITDDRRMIQVPKTKGLLVVFKSDMLHRVRPVKSGLRKSIVGWITGPAWK